MDNLARCAMLAKRDGVSYGHWMALHGEKEIKKKEKEIPAGCKVCNGCGKIFRGKPNQKYCDANCRETNGRKKYREIHIEQIREKQRRYYHERKKKHESSC